MRRQLTTRAQVSGYRFVLRRMDHVLLRRDARMISDPMASQSKSLIAGIILALVITGGCGILALIRPQGAVGDAKIVLAKDSGELFVRAQDVLHPVSGLASARLIVGEAAAPVQVKDNRLKPYRRGPEVGIADAPGQILGPQTAWTQGATPWLICDQTTLAPADQPAAVDQLETLVATTNAGVAERGSLLVRHNGTFFLLFGGFRAPINVDDAAVRRVAGLETVDARGISTHLLNAFEETDPIAVPQISGRGRPSTAFQGSEIGDIVRVADTDRDRLYVILGDGVQAVGQWAADLIRAGDASGRDIVTVPGAKVAAARAVRSVPVLDLPDQRPQVRPTAETEVACAAASTDGKGGGTVELRTFGALPTPGAPVVLSAADGPGDALDLAYVPAGTGEYVRSAQPGGVRQDGLFYVSDSGVRYGIADQKVAQTLGLQHKPRPVAWWVLGALPAGPDLDPKLAATTRDGVTINVKDQ